MKSYNYKSEGYKLKVQVVHQPVFDSRCFVSVSDFSKKEYMYMYPAGVQVCSIHEKM